MSGYQFIEELNNNSIFIPTAILSGYITHEKLNEFKEIGIVGYIPKTSNTERFIKAIKSIVNGDYYFSEDAVLEHEATLQATRLATAEKLGISPRQLQVLESINENLSNQAIADKLFISLDTVKSHIKSLYLALDTNTRMGCTQQAQKAGLID